MTNEEMIGKRFERLTVIKQVDDYVSKSGRAHKRFLCVCDCGTQKEFLKEHLVSGRTKSCGCLRSERGRKAVKHGEIHTRLYRTWSNMLTRCYNPNVYAYKNYGGRGIIVCDEWHEYKKFSEWARRTGYTDELTIDRINNDGNYCPENCRWADEYTQANNKRNIHWITYNNETKSIKEWARELNVSYKALHSRIVRYGWSVERAFTQPYRKSSSEHSR